MYLKSLTLKGFKSFASATTLKFEPGICAVVGPNGSGKSNVVDALAWVMGEQGAKTLRGGKMDDVIFAGAGQRKPLGRAEVTLTIDNSDNVLPIEYKEVSITRRMFRDGASEYEINGNKARLMDIQELLSDSGIGREMHVIVGQGRLAQILESRPEDRRAFIEEAAGVLKHRRRKEKAQRKLVNMQANLDRLQDLTAELARQLKPLARQADAARRAASVQADVRDVRLQLGGYQIVQLQEKLAAAQSRTQIVKEHVEEVSEQLEEATEITLELEDQLATITPAAEQAQQLWFSLSSLAERVSATQRIAADRAINVQLTAYSGTDPEELFARAERADKEYAELEENVALLTARLESIQEQVAEYEHIAQEADREHLAQVRAIADRREGVVRLLAAEEAQQAHVLALEAELARMQETLAEARQRIEITRTHLREVEAKISVAEPDKEEYIRATAEAEAAEQRLEDLRMQQHHRERNVSRLESRIETLSAQQGLSDGAALFDNSVAMATLVRAKKGCEKALAAVLAQVADGLAAPLPVNMSELVVAHSADIATTMVFAMEDTAQREKTQANRWRLDAYLPQSVTWLLDELSIDDRVAQAINRLLIDVVVAPSLAVAETVVRDDPRLRAVTYEGVIVGDGWYSFGQGAGKAVEITAYIEQAELELAQEIVHVEELLGTLSGAKQAADQARVRAASATASLQEQEAVFIGLKKDVERLRAQEQAHVTEYQRSAQRVGEMEQRLNKARQQWNITKDRLARVDRDIDDQDPSTHERDQAQENLAQIKAMELEAKLSLRSAQDRAEQASGRGASLRRQADHERMNKQRHEQMMHKRVRQAELARTVDTYAREINARVEKAVAQATRRRDELMTQRQAIVARLSQAKDKAQALNTQLLRLSDQAHQVDVQRSQAQVRLEEAQKKLQEQLGIAIPDLIRDYTPGADFDLGFQQDRLKKAEKALSSLGKVNPLALEEYKALEERYEFLSTQLSDVQQARTDLLGVVEDVDAKILQLFSDAWHDVEEEFPKVFRTLFPGGEGRLVLTEPEDMLRTGIEVEARPPGKKVKRLSLLSGGEKSLTALAMLVAIFRARPSPFYVMDEVEAALDDVNLRRLIALFEELRLDSQLIVITHQKPTMDIANVLYGVTMRGDGVTKVISQRMSTALMPESASGVVNQARDRQATDPGSKEVAD
ncbi:chromosome segregation protein SMC [Corynebacterium kutscheri]|uniref:chromosome segregation protein SMC n=1 Tax=Corynebacterium kutscheri TaxID=35755 RepID=UPI0037C19398